VAVAGSRASGFRLLHSCRSRGRRSRRVAPSRSRSRLSRLTSSSLDPRSGGVAAPTFRALVAADLPFSLGNWTLTGNIADLATSGAMTVGNTNTTEVGFSPGGTALSRIYTDGTFNYFEGKTTNTKFIGAFGTGIADQSGALYFYTTNAATWVHESAGDFSPTSFNSRLPSLVGGSTPTTATSHVSNWYSEVLGSSLASATTITPTSVDALPHGYHAGLHDRDHEPTAKLPREPDSSCASRPVRSRRVATSPTPLRVPLVRPTCFWWDGTTWHLEGDQDALAGSLTSGRFTLSNGTRAVTDSTAFTFSGTTATMTNLTVSALAKAQRLANQSSAPTIAVGAGTQLGTTPSATCSGGDIGGSCTLTTGTTPAAFVANTAVNLGVVTFNTTFSTAPKAGVLTPCNNAAATVSTGTSGLRAYIDRATFSTTQTTIKLVSSGTPTLAASTAYEFCYVVIQ
jgi:hypothetical protein